MHGTETKTEIKMQILKQTLDVKVDKFYEDLNVILEVLQANI